MKIAMCECGHSIRSHSFGPGRPVSCGRVNCPCLRWRPKAVEVEKAEPEDFIVDTNSRYPYVMPIPESESCSLLQRFTNFLKKRLLK